MYNYMIKRSLNLVVILLILSIVVFLYIHLIPGDPAAVMLGSESNPKALQELRQQLGLNDPLYVQYFSWIKQVFQGNIGMSLHSHMPVAELILQRLPVTLTLSVAAFAISIMIGIPLGIVSAVRSNTFTDYVVTILSLIGLSIPEFWAGLLLVMLFSVKLNLLPFAGYSIDMNIMQNIQYFIIPAFAMGLIQSAIVSRMTRSSFLDVLDQDYIRTARAKGLKQSVIILKHVLKNSMLPIITVLGINFGILLGGTVVIEIVCNLPGLGSLTVSSIMNRDYPVIQGILMYIAFIYLLVNFIVDILYGLLDPRIHYS
ncbi:ABC transporter permease [Paenibacillus filicis]|uniref:ABC transporter permease n=1 Tax=Paenibacillus gyeongsangnamensis TaxID=3388067 RepID=A0ABT4Q3Y2_9BACL|nr:ABC transporter permease [Paenibacillus filicis]MCZ8511521.1 ABC transporter permease [Paenibacillus filicis]